MITRGSPSLTMLPSLYMRFCSTPGTRARTSDARVGARRPEASRTSGTGAGVHDDARPLPEAGAAVVPAACRRR